MSAVPSTTPASGDLIENKYRSTTITCIVAAASAIVTLFYLVALYLVAHRWTRDDTSLNKYSSVRLQRSAPFVYLLLVLTSLIEISISAWILVQYSYNLNYPSEAAKTGIEFILFSGCWTMLVVGSYLLLFLHPRLSKSPVASVGVQGLWICLTWILWIVAAAYLNAVLPFVTVYSECTLVYCGQLKALFAISVVQTVFFAFAMFVILWLAWQRVHGK
ncbi:hypothetical protein BJ322DRAFT_390660 [Thelephora terrestris]|uniref:MARVEL domain-containing protein n=1 Tax=Thelephora terrestris TaxID=56493 RepID=A0A9P6HLV1_9AGAM|nr:hypothetical protein BJ322DRAFT_390660 [Thelephora terrestris]